ncbi:MAG TPA: hypothetical protein VE890_04180 [Thermoguttaceae bacterium]|nr:hypothetical protein [Thermoguttaceae bacterium]
MNADLCQDAMPQVEPATQDPSFSLSEAAVRDYVSGFIDRRAEFLSLVDRYGSPLYVFDESTLRLRTQTFRQAFEQVFPLVSCYFAMKSNNHPLVAATVLSEGFGLDVSSGVELEAAFSSGACDVAFSGPGKTQAELVLAVENAERVTVLIDSFGELRRLAEIAQARRTSVRCGVRITPPNGKWRKFGVPLEKLRSFWEEAEQCQFVELGGLQFHTSWNHGPARQIEMIEAIDREISRWPKRLLTRIAFLDIGGGFWPPQGEWLLDAGNGGRCVVPAEPIEVFARQLAERLQECVLDLSACRICFEPGRWICNDAMHLLLTVVDKKEEDLAIVDAGTNAIGWERFESDYAPLINLSRPTLVEKTCQVLGSLCTPHDVWGNAYWGDDLLPGDVLLVPDQGAYTYSLCQHFIKQVPLVVSLDPAVADPRRSLTLRVPAECAPMCRTS